MIANLFFISIRLNIIIIDLANIIRVFTIFSQLWYIYNIVVQIFTNIVIIFKIFIFFCFVFLEKMYYNDIKCLIYWHRVHSNYNLSFFTCRVETILNYSPPNNASKTISKLSYKECHYFY